MASVKFSVNLNVLKWAISNSDIGFDGVREYFPKLDSWLTGEDCPTFVQLESLSKKTHIPLGYFMLDKPPEEKFTLLDYRTIDSNSVTKISRDLADTIYEMESRQQWMRDYLKREDFGKLKFIGSINIEDNFMKNVDKIREDVGLDPRWYCSFNKSADQFKYLRTLAERKGILVMVNGVVASNTHRSLNLNEFRAFAMSDEYAPLIFINGKDSKAGRLFSLCHEIAHLWFGYDNLFNDNSNGNGNYRNDIEKECNAITAELLVPNNAFLEIWTTDNAVNVLDKAENLSKTFNVSKIVIARRALDNNKISNDDYRFICEKTLEVLSKKKESSDRTGNYYNNFKYSLDNRFFKAINSSVKQGELLFTDAYRLTGLNRNSFDKFESMI